MKDLNKRIKEMSEISKATIVFMICSIMQKTISIISAPIFTRIMSVDDYGLFSMYQTWLFLFTILTTFRLDYDVFNKGMNKYKKNQKEYLTTMQMLTTTITIILCIIYCIFRESINNVTGLSTLITLFMFLELMFTPAISFWTLSERYNFKYKKLFVVTCFMSLLNLVIGVIAVVTYNNKGIARILSCVIIQVIFGVYIYIYNLRNSKKIFCLEYAKFAIIFNIPLIPHYFSSYVLSSADKIMIQNMCGLSEAGIYSVVYNIGLVFTMISTGVNNSLIPLQYQKISKAKYSELNDILKYAILFISVISIIFIAISPELLYIMADKKYYSGLYVIPPVVVSVYFIFLFNLICNVEFYFDKNKFTMYISCFVAILNIILNYIFIKIFGFIAAGYTTLICYFLVMLFHLAYSNYISKKELNIIIYDTKVIIITSIVLIIFALILTLFYEMLFIRYLFVLVLLIYSWFNKEKFKLFIKKKENKLNV